MMFKVRWDTFKRGVILEFLNFIVSTYNMDNTKMLHELVGFTSAALLFYLS